MLNHFASALSSSNKVRLLDPLASLAEAMLGLNAMVIVERQPDFSILGSSSNARVLDEATLIRAADGKATVLDPDQPDSARVLGAHFDGPRPFAGLLRVPLNDQNAELLMFPRDEGVTLGDLRCVIRAVARQMAEHRMVRRFQADLKRHVTLFDLIQRSAKVGVFEYDPQQRSTFWSGAIYRLYDLAPGTPPPANALDNFPEPGREQLQDALRLTRKEGVATDLTLPFVSTKDRRRTIRVVADRVLDAERRAMVVGTMQDVTSLVDATTNLWWSANHDSLTGLPNRSLLNDRVTRALKRRQRVGSMLALLVLDVDDFKNVNDNHGHSAGDEALKAVAASLKDAVRASDTVARTGGDEFVILMEEFCDLEQVHLALSRIKANLTVSFDWAGRRLQVTLSAGVVVSPLHGNTQRELIDSADVALYRMKARRGAALALFDEAETSAVSRRTDLLARTRLALTEDAIGPHFQPQIDLLTGHEVGVEAFARWLQPDGTVLPAREFEEVLDDRDVGAQISRTVMDRALEEMAAFNRERGTQLGLSVNAFAWEILNAGYLERLMKRRAAVAPDLPVTVEIAHEAILADEGPLRDALVAASDAGIRISLSGVDLEGAGIVRRAAPLRPSEVKLCPTVAKALVSSDLAPSGLTRFLRAMAEEGISVIMEGVETAGEAAQASRFKVPVAQGHYYSPAATLGELSALLLPRSPRRIPPPPARLASA